MKLTNIRSCSTGDSTLGILLKDNKPLGFVIEDEHRKVKVKGETRIPKGVYNLKLRREVTPLTKRYRKRFPWFKYHIELENVARFTGIYIHVGNFEKDTAGCQCVGYDASVKGGEFCVLKSTMFFKQLYLDIVRLLERGINVTYEIVDNDLNHIAL